MNNANKPINPLRGADGTIFTNDGYADQVDLLSGLTKREYFAGLAMQGLLANNAICNHNEGLPDISVVLTYADALLNELSKTK